MSLGITDNSLYFPEQLQVLGQEILLSLTAELRISLFHNDSPFPEHHQQQESRPSLPLRVFPRIFS